MGGPLFMGILTLIFIGILAVAFVYGIPVLKGKSAGEGNAKLNYIKDLGLFALVVGILGQLIGLFSAFRAIEMHMVEVSPGLMAQGFKVSMITTIYGLIIYAVSLALWMGVRRGR